ncbi:MAG TPA: sugar phosphate isomerase/epimerase family protein [Micromonosporaceae bacterium]
MMKLSVSAWSFDQKIRSGEWDTAQFVTAMGGLDVDAVDLNTRYLPELSEDALRPVKEASIRATMPFSALRCVNDFGDPDSEGQLRYMDTVLRAATFLGAPRIRVYAGWPKDDYERDWKTMLDTLRRAADRAGEYGVQLIIENHNHGGFLQTSEQVLAVLDAVQHPALGLLLDPGNYLDGMTSVVATADRAVWLDLKIWEMTEEGGDAGLDYPEIIRTVHATGFDGYCSVEYEPKDRSHEYEDVQRAIRYFRPLLSPAGD